MKNIRLYILFALLLMAGGMTMQAQVAGEFYSFAGWEDNNGGSGIRNLAHYTEHGKKVELPYSYLIDDPEAMGIGNDFITDATPGVLYNKESTTCHLTQTSIGLSRMHLAYFSRQISILRS